MPSTPDVVKVKYAEPNCSSDEDDICISAAEISTRALCEVTENIVDGNVVKLPDPLESISAWRDTELELTDTACPITIDSELLISTEVASILIVALELEVAKYVIDPF